MMASEFVRLDCIGAGSFGKVWLVRYTPNGRSYVLKEVHVRGLTDKEIDQAVSEVKILSHLGHFNIIRYKQAFVEDQSLNIIMEYADAGDLHSKIQSAQGEYFDERQVINWFIQIAFALKYIHKENILHRDLKTQNIFLTKENVVKVGDFGIAKALMSDSGQADTAIGTPYYLSPEICQSKSYNKKSDIWALGCVLYEIATLKNAFDGSNFNSLVMKIVHGEHGKLPSHYPFNPVSSLIEMMLQHEPDDRPTADQVLRLPILRPHIARYEQMALKLIEAKQAKKTGVSSVRRGRKHSLSEEPDSNKNSPVIVTKKRSHSVDSGIKKKNDLRRSVILRQALTRHSSVSGSTYKVITPVQPASSEEEDSDSSPIPSGYQTPPSTPVSTNDKLVSSSSGSSVDVCDVESSEPDDMLDTCSNVLLSAHRGDRDQAITEITSLLNKRLGESQAQHLLASVDSHMEQSLDDSSVFFPVSELREVGRAGQTEMIMLSMLQWYLRKEPH